MNNYLFFEDISNYLKEGEQMPQQPKVLDVNVQQSWKKMTNFGYRKGVDPNDPNNGINQLRPILFFNFKITPDEFEQLSEKFGNSLSKYMCNVQENGNNVTFALKINKLDTKNQGSKVVNAVFDFFKGLGYQVPSQEELLKNTVSKEDFIETEKNANEKWTGMLQSLASGELDEVAEKYIQIFGKLFEYVHGHQLSLRNAKLILSQKPDASFVTTANNWEKFFNCKVKPGAQQIKYFADWSDMNKVGADDAQKFADTHGIDFNKNDAKYQGQAMYAMKLQASNRYGIGGPAVGYDSSEVDPIDPNDDWRITRYGMKNNLTGEPNDLTREYLSQTSVPPENEKLYNTLKKMLDNNAELYFKVLVTRLEEMGMNDFREVFENEYEEWCKNKGVEPDYEIKTCYEFLHERGWDEYSVAPDGRDAISDFGIVAKYRSMAKTKNNPDFFTLFPRLLREYVDKLLESEYKIARDTHRAASVTRICGVVLYMCGVWDSQSITALKGGVVNKETLIHDSNIINKLLEMFSKEREGVQRELIKLIKNAEIKQPNKEMTDNNTMGLNEVKKEMFEQILMTPDKLANMLDLKVVDDNKPSDEETIQENKEKFYEMVQRMNNAFKNQ